MVHTLSWTELVIAVFLLFPQIKTVFRTSPCANLDSATTSLTTGSVGSPFTAITYDELSLWDTRTRALKNYKELSWRSKKSHHWWAVLKGLSDKLWAVLIWTNQVYRFVFLPSFEAEEKLGDWRSSHYVLIHDRTFTAKSSLTIATCRIGSLRKDHLNRLGPSTPSTPWAPHYLVFFFFVKTH